MSKTEEKKSKLDYVPSHCMTGKYAVLMETSGEEQESWYYFIKVEGNEENLKHLSEQLESVEWYLLDDLSEFQLDMEYFVSAQTAKEMTKIDLNYVSFHHKFDGVLQKIDLGFRKKDGNSTKISKTFDVLGFGQIENFIDDEDLDEEDLVTDFEDDDDTDNESLSESDKESDASDKTPKIVTQKKKIKLPPSNFNSSS